MPKVSIIIPNFNHEKFLAERIDSVLGQTYQDFELILLDDCSTDGSRDILEKYRSNPKVSHIVYNEINSGSSFRQWDKGISLARGELIWIAESDDSCTNDLLQSLVAAFDTNPSLVLAFCPAMQTDAEGRLIALHPLHQELAQFLGDGKRFVKSFLCRQNYVVNASGALFRKKAYLNLPAFAEQSFRSFRGVGDWLFWIGISLQGDVACIQKGQNYFRQHGANTTSSLRKSGIGFIEAAKLMSILEDHSVISKWRALQLRAANAAIIKYKNTELPSEAKRECLEAWRGHSIMVEILASIKRFIHPKRYK